MADIDARIDEVTAAGVAASEAIMAFAQVLSRLADDAENAVLTHGQREACAFAPEMVASFIQSMSADLTRNAALVAAWAKVPS
jgi:hypothetical protein